MLSSNEEFPECKMIHYDVDSWSSFYENYYPENVLLHQNTRIDNRWCTDIQYQPEFIILRIEPTNIPLKLTFVKANSSMVGALKQFVILASYDKIEWYRVFDGHSNFGISIEDIHFQIAPINYPSPIRYLKIVVLSSWACSQVVSVWPFFLTGYNSPTFSNKLLQKYLQRKSETSLMECLSKLRTVKNRPHYIALKNSIRTNQIPLLDQLYTNIVMEENFEKASRIIDEFSTTNAFNKFYDNLKHKVQWTLLQPNGTFQNDGTLQPKMRGGHQMCIDSKEGLIYMYGGWDGEVDLGDFWLYHIKTNKWELISQNTAWDGGPSPRSCHQMCMDKKRKQIYVLGKFKDYNLNELMDNEFFVYDIKTKIWTDLSSNGLYGNGPPLCFGHQMIFCEKNDKIFVFGGNILSEKYYSTKCGQFYTYDITSKCWRSGYYSDDKKFQVAVEPRSDHSMHIDEELGRIYITGGSVASSHINEFCYIDVNDGSIHYIDDINIDSLNSNPNYCYTMRSTFNSNNKEIYLFSGLQRYKRYQSTSPSCNSLYVYEIEKNRWSCIYENKHTGFDYWSKFCIIYPVPRFAFQFVYDEINKVNYLFGGNPGKYSIQCARLNDMWSCKISKPAKSDLIKQMKEILYMGQINLWAMENPLKACAQLRLTSYLFNKCNNDRDIKIQNLISQIIDFYDPNQEYFKFNENSISYSKNLNLNCQNFQEKRDESLQNIFESLSLYFFYESFENISLI